jgi:hypothetical protein
VPGLGGLPVPWALTPKKAKDMKASKQKNARHPITVKAGKLSKLIEAETKLPRQRTGELLKIVLEAVQLVNDSGDRCLKRFEAGDAKSYQEVTSAMFATAPTD